MAYATGVLLNFSMLNSLIASTEHYRIKWWAAEEEKRKKKLRFMKLKCQNGKTFRLDLSSSDVIEPRSFDIPLLIEISQ